MWNVLCLWWSVTDAPMMECSVLILIAAGLLLTLIKESSGAVSCPSGDVAEVIKDGKTCTQLVTSSTKRECYDTTVETSCCASCNAVAITIPDCTYGDGVSPCFTFICSSISNPTDCCETCSTDSTTVTATTTTTSETTVSATTASVTTVVATTGAATSSASTTTAAANAETRSENDSSNVGIIVGGVIGGLAGTAIVGVGIYAGDTLYKKFKKQPVHCEDSNSSDIINDDPLPLKGTLTSVPRVIVTVPGGCPLSQKDELITNS